MRSLSLVSVSAGLAVVLGCASVKTGTAGPDGGGGGGGGGAGGIAAGTDARVDRGTPTMPAACGNHERTADEACDDGNLVSGDGCSANCMVVESGFSCQPPGQPCHRVARCGD